MRGKSSLFSQDFILIGWSGFISNQENGEKFPITVLEGLLMNNDLLFYVNQDNRQYSVLMV